MNLQPFDRFPVLTTPRLVLREPGPEDAEALAALRSDEDVARYQSQEAAPTPEAARALIARWRRRFSFKAEIRWVIASREDGAFLGTCAFAHFVPRFDRGHVIYELARGAWGRGLATEAVRAMVAFGHDEIGLDRIEAVVVPEHQASARVLRKAGFVEEGVMRAYGSWRGRRQDLRMFSSVRVRPEASDGAPVAGGPNLVVLRATGARPPLFLVGVAGVNALGYVALSRGLPADQPVYVVQPTRRGPKFPPEGIGPGGRDEYARVAAEYLASIRTVQPEGPYFLGGSCDGALVAFEMARRLEAEGQRVAMLAVFDTWPLENTTVYPLVMFKLWRRSWQGRSPAERRALLRRKADEAILRGGALLRPPPPGDAATGPSDGALSEDARREVWRSRLWPGPGFQPPVIDAPIAVLRVSEQPYWRIQDEALGWRGRTRGEVTVHILPGDHLNWARPPSVAAFSRTLAAYLEPSPPPGRGRERADGGARAAAPPLLADAEALSPRSRRILDAVKRGAHDLVTLLHRGP